MGDDFPTSLSHLRFCMADNVAIMADNVATICWLLVVFHYYSKKKRERERERESETERERVRLRERERERVTQKAGVEVLSYVNTYREGICNESVWKWGNSS